MKKLTKQEQKDEASDTYRKAVDPALKIFDTIRYKAREIYLAKLREIDEKDIKIINGKRYKLIDED